MTGKGKKGWRRFAVSGYKYLAFGNTRYLCRWMCCRWTSLDWRHQLVPMLTLLSWRCYLHPLLDIRNLIQSSTIWSSILEFWTIFMKAKYECRLSNGEYHRFPHVMRCLQRVRAWRTLLSFYDLIFEFFFCICPPWQTPISVLLWINWYVIGYMVISANKFSLSSLQVLRWIRDAPLVISWNSTGMTLPEDLLIFVAIFVLPTVMAAVEKEFIKTHKCGGPRPGCERLDN